MLKQDTQRNFQRNSKKKISILTPLYVKFYHNDVLPFRTYTHKHAYYYVLCSRVTEHVVVYNIQKKEHEILEKFITS